jgi:hypothetical protein
MFMINLLSKFHMSSPNCSFVIVIKPTAKENFRAVKILLFDILQETT